MGLAVLTCIGFMLLGSLFGWMTGTEVDTAWYESLVRPQFEPPAALVLLVHLLYYPLFFVILYRAFSRPHGPGPRRTIVLLAIAALAINTAWNPFLIGLQALAVGVAGNALLLAIVAVLAFFLRKRDRTSALLLLPYVAWVAFDLLWALQLYRLNL